MRKYGSNGTDTTTARRATRAISRTAAAGFSRCSRTSRQVTASNVRSANGSEITDPQTRWEAATSAREAGRRSRQTGWTEAGSTSRRSISPSPHPASSTEWGSSSARTARSRRKNRPITKLTTGFGSAYFSCRLIKAQWDKALPCPSERSSDFLPPRRRGAPMATPTCAPNHHAEPYATSFSLPARGAQAQHMTDVLQRMQGVDFALAADALAHLIAALVDLAHVAAHQQFHQALVTERPERYAGHGFAAHQVAAAQRVRNAGVDLRQQKAADLRGAPGTDAAGQSPIAQAAAIAMARGNDQVGAGAALQQAAQNVRRMLEIGVHGAQDPPARDLPAANYGHGEAAFVLSAHHPQFREALAQTRGNFPRPVGAVVIHHDDLVVAGQRQVQGVADGAQKIGDVLPLVQRRPYQREYGLRAAGGRGREAQRSRGRGDDMFGDESGLTIPWGGCQWMISPSGYSTVTRNRMVYTGPHEKEEEPSTMRGFCVFAVTACMSLCAADLNVATLYDSQLRIAESEVVSLAEAMPESAYSFAPTKGAFEKVRTFGEQVKHIATVIYMAGAASAKEKPPVDLGTGENGPDAVETKAQTVQYLKDSFAYGHTR